MGHLVPVRGGPGFLEASENCWDVVVGAAVTWKFRSPPAPSGTPPVPKNPMGSGSGRVGCGFEDWVWDKVLVLGLGYGFWIGFWDCVGIRFWDWVD